MRTVLKLDDGQPIACGSIDPLPGSSQVAVFHSAFVLPQYRNSGHGDRAHYERIFAAKEALYDYGLVTVDSKNEVQIKILKKWEWTLLAEFKSNKTGHIVGLWGRPLYPG